MQSTICVRGGVALFIGPLPDLPPHAHAVPALCVGLDHPFELKAEPSREWQSYRSCIVPGGLQHSLRGLNQRFAALYFDPESPVAHGLWKSAAAAAAVQDLDDGAWIWIAALEAVANAQDGTDLALRVDDLLHAAAANAWTRPAALDPRIQQVIRLLLEVRDEHYSADELAQSVGMSGSWLLHEFPRQVGVPFNRFRAWFRMKAAVVMIKSGATHVEAALATGFSDQSHFSNAFRAMFGLAPTAVFRKMENLRWHIDHEELTRQLCAFLKSA